MNGVKTASSINDDGKTGQLWHPTPVFLPGESHGRRSLEGYSPQGLTESDTTVAT